MLKKWLKTFYCIITTIFFLGFITDKIMVLRISLKLAKNHLKVA